jgi:hypothetical protein
MILSDVLFVSFAEIAQVSMSLQHKVAPTMSAACAFETPSLPLCLLVSDDGQQRLQLSRRRQHQR